MLEKVQSQRSMQECNHMGGRKQSAAIDQGHGLRGTVRQEDDTHTASSLVEQATANDDGLRNIAAARQSDGSARLLWRSIISFAPAPCSIVLSETPEISDRARQDLVDAHAALLLAPGRALQRTP